MRGGRTSLITITVLPDPVCALRIGIQALVCACSSEVQMRRAGSKGLYQSIVETSEDPRLREGGPPALALLRCCNKEHTTFKLSCCILAPCFLCFRMVSDGSTAVELPVDTLSCSSSWLQSQRQQHLARLAHDDVQTLQP
jgi:hypothetical protein